MLTLQGMSISYNKAYIPVILYEDSVRSILSTNNI